MVVPTLQVDEMMWTHLPTADDERRYPGLTALVTKYMIHEHTERCGGLKSPCRWGFPHAPVEHTHRTADGKWVTWRRVGDEWVASYHPRVLIRIRRHANWIVTCGTASIGYLLKYPLKGDTSLRAAITTAYEERDAAPEGERRKIDEVKITQTNRCVSASEAFYRLMGYRMVEQFPPVQTIKVTLPENRCTFGSKDTAAQQLRDMVTDAERYFQRPAALHDVDMRTYYERYSIARKAPKRRAYFADGAGTFVSERAKPVLLNIVPAKFNSKGFYARMLLMQPDSFPCSWEDLRRVNVTNEDGISSTKLCDSYMEAARERGLLQDHKTAVNVLAEFLTTQLTTPTRARFLFVQVRPQMHHLTAAAPPGFARCQ